MNSETNDQRFFTNLPFDEAQRLAAFRMVMPTNIPVQFSFTGVAVNPPPRFHSKDPQGQAPMVTPNFRKPRQETPASTAGEFMLAEGFFDPIPGDAGGEITTFSVDGQQVTRTVFPKITVYSWRNRRLSFCLYIPGGVDPGVPC